MLIQIDVKLYVHYDAKQNRTKISNSNQITIKKFILSIEEFNENTDWNKITWEKVIDQIKKGLEYKDKQNENILINDLIEDYVHAMENIIKIANKITDFYNCFVGGEFKFVDFYKQTKSERFRYLRIHDLVGKIAFNKLEKIILAELKNNNKSPENNRFILNSYTFYSRQQPGIGFEWLYTNGLKKKKEKRFSIGVQIQGDTLAHFVEFYPSYDKASVFANDKMKEWLFPEGEEFKGNKNNGQLLKFDKEKFLYTKISIESLLYEELLKRVKSSLSFAVKVLNKNEGSFLEEVKEFIKH